VQETQGKNHENSGVFGERGWRLTAGFSPGRRQSPRPGSVNPYLTRVHSRSSAVSYTRSRFSLDAVAGMVYDLYTTKRLKSQ